MTAFIFILVAIFLLGAGCGVAVWFALRQRQPIGGQKPTETSAPAKALPFRWSYIVAPVATLILSAILAALFYPHLPAEVGYHFTSTGAPDRWLSREAAVALMLIPQFFLTLLAGGITWGITRLGIVLLRQPEALGMQPQRISSFIGNIAALPQFALGFTMLNIFSYNVFQILILPTWIFLLILGLSTIALGVLLILVILKARGQLFRQPEKLE